ncbi:MAG TPA: prepilin-type N-terminal cleavage/methylation domain-containing protein [Gemmatimonadaceae bacterium]|nr:prepilin-type N-terminal cleavage/methylation domain-containing protein [Gemmatimonadaceae bacterium]
MIPRSSARRHRAPRQRRARARTAGFTLVELMVAIMVMTVGILGLASSAALVTRMMSGGSRQTIAASVVQRRFEQLRNLQCSLLASGDTTTRGVQETWTVTREGANLALVVDTLRFQGMTGEPTSVQGYQSYVRCTAS